MEMLNNIIKKDKSTKEMVKSGYKNTTKKKKNIGIE